MTEINWDLIHDAVITDDESEPDEREVAAAIARMSVRTHQHAVLLTESHKVWRYPNGSTLSIDRRLLEYDDPDRIDDEQDALGSDCA